MSEQKQETVALPLSALEKILAENARQNAEQLKTVIAELRKPTVLEQKKLDEEQKELMDRNEERKANGAAMIQKIENKRTTQRICSHKHRDGNSHCVLVQVQNQPPYILCQKNQCKIHPGAAPKDYQGTDIYSTDLYNTLFQTLPSNELFG